MPDPTPQRRADDLLAAAEKLAAARVIAQAEVAAAERIARLETSQAYSEKTLEQHAAVHAKLAGSMDALVASLSSMKRNLVIATIVLFGGTANGGKLAETVASLFQ